MRADEIEWALHPYISLKQIAGRPTLIGMTLLFEVFTILNTDCYDDCD